MPSVDLTQQAIVVEAPVDVSVVEFTSAGVTVEVPSTTLVLEFGTAGTLIPGSGLTGGGTLTGNVPIGLSSATVASLLKADTAVQPGANLSGFVDDVGYATDAEVFALLSGLSGSFQPLNTQLTSISGMITTAFGRGFLALANEAAARTLIGVYSTSEVSSLLATKANSSHTHLTADITGGISWSSLTDVPSVFPTGAHTHVKADVTDFAHTHVMADLTDYAAASVAWGSITGTLSAQTDLQAALDAKSATGHTHDDRYYTELEITSLLAGYAASAHVHTFASITSKPTTLAGYGITDAAGSAHTHTFASLTSKPTTLAGYGITDAAALSHTHDYAASSHTHDYAASSHTHSYLPLSGGTLTGNLTVSAAGSHIYLVDTDGPDPSDFSLIEVNGGYLNLYLRDLSADAWRLPFQANISTGALSLGVAGAMTIVQGSLQFQSGYLYGTGGSEAVRAYYGGDTWLRLNQSGHFSSGTYTPGKIRADGSFSCNDSVTMSAGAGGSLRITNALNPTWYADIGAQNSGYVHMNAYGVSSGFYFGSDLNIGTRLKNYTTGYDYLSKSVGVSPKWTRGTAAPTGGNDGDLYSQYT